MSYEWGRPRVKTIKSSVIKDIAEKLRSLLILVQLNKLANIDTALLHKPQDFVEYYILAGLL